MTTTRDIARTISERCTALRLRSAARVMTRSYDQALGSVGIKLSQLTVLVGVAMFGELGAPVTELADAIVLDRTTLTRNLRPLLSQGLVRSGADREDRRSRRIQLTRKGEQLLAEAYPLWLRAQTNAESALGSHVRSLGVSLDEVLQRIEVTSEPSSEA